MKGMNKMELNGAQLIVKSLEKAHIKKVYGVPGEQILPFVDAIYDSSEIDFISARHEGGAAFMAEAYGKAARTPAVCIGTAGVGAANITLGIHTAKQDSTPLIVLIGQVNSEYRGREAWQEIDFDPFYSHIAKWSVEINDVNRIQEIMKQAIQTSMSGRPGPVVISVPEDILEKLTTYKQDHLSTINKVSLLPEDIAGIVKLINQSNRPLILAGGGINASGAKNYLIQFSEESNIPVMSAFRRHDIFPNNHENYLGNSGLGTFPETLETLYKADLILAIGTRLSDITTQNYRVPNEQQKIIHIDIDEEVLVNQSFLTPHLSIQADAKCVLELLNEQTSNLNNINKYTDWKSVQKEKYENNIEQRKIERYTNFGDSFLIEKVIDDMHDVLPDNTIITSDAGNFFTWFANYYEFRKDQQYFGPTSGAMGYGLPAAIAAKQVYPERPVISLSGDGGYMMTFQEFETAVRYEIPIISIIFNNNSHGAIRFHQERQYPKRVIGTALTNPPFDEMAKLFGGNGYKVTHNKDFVKVLKKALQNNGPTIIEVPTNLKMLSATVILEESDC